MLASNLATGTALAQPDTKGMKINSTTTLVTLLLITLTALAAQAPVEGAEQRFVPPDSPRVRYSFNPGWKFVREDVAGSEQPGFDDSRWTTVSTPHTYNDVDSFDQIISRGGETSLYMGAATYRKHFKLPASAAKEKVFLEFEGMRQAARFYVNGKPVGKYENGVTPCGLDITEAVHFGDQGNVLTVKITNVTNYREEASDVGYQWGSRDFNPNYGGLNRDVWLHIAGKVYQTLPLYENLKTAGVYVHATDLSVTAKTAEVAIETQVRNESGEPQKVALSAVIVDTDGVARATLKGETHDLASGETTVMKALGPLANVNFWDDRNPYLYNVYSILTVEDKVVDVDQVTTGFRKTEFKGGAGTGGIYVNDRFVYLKGYAIRSVNEWAALGGAYPDWMHEFSASLIREGHGNYVRWMHIAPKAQDVRAPDRFGIIQVCPAGDKEADAQGRQWEQRLEVMRDTMIYYRNNPSILFWEAGNNGVSAAHMQQMVNLRKEWDPSGGRVMGCRTLHSPDTTHITEYFGVMVGQDRRTDLLQGSQMFRAFSFERRDLAPFIETEDFRDEVARRFWDDYSPPHFGFKPGPKDTYNWNSETFCLAAAKRYYEYFSNIITNRNAEHARWSGYASIIFADSNQHGRQASSEVCRTSGKVDAVRLPKQAWFLHRVMQNERPDIHIIGHWNYPSNTTKVIYVAANQGVSVELFLNDKSKGVIKTPMDGYIYAFPATAFEPGTLKAVAMFGGKVVAQHELQTAGPAKSLKLTAQTGPKGLVADGSDVAFFDVEVVDAQGRRCPTDEARVDFAVDGPMIWRGGYNSGKPDSINHLHLDTECGINRVFIRSTLQPGTITLTAARAGLTPAKIQIESRPVVILNGLLRELTP